MKNRQGRTSVQKDPRERDGRVVGLDIDVIIRTRMVNSNYNVQLLLRNRLTITYYHLF